MQCPPDYPAVAIMVVMAGLVGRKLGIRPKQKDEISQGRYLILITRESPAQALAFSSAVHSNNAPQANNIALSLDISQWQPGAYYFTKDSSAAITSYLMPTTTSLTHSLLLRRFGGFMGEARQSAAQLLNPHGCLLISMQHRPSQVTCFPSGRQSQIELG